MNYNLLNERYSELKNKKQELFCERQIILDKAQEIIAEDYRVIDIARNSDKIITELNREFEEKTGLTKTDCVFLFTAVGLQMLRQYALTDFKKRPDHKAATERIYTSEKHSNRHHRYYNPSLEEILSNPVPFDALNNANGALKGGGKFRHRGSTLGHDPLLGLIFGTANIATSTLTTTNLKSYHISTKNKKDFFRNRASTPIIFESVGKKLFLEGPEGQKKVGASLILEIQHLISDSISKDSLPLPFLPLIDGLKDTQLASDIAKYGIDFGNVATVSKQLTMSAFINSIVAMMHRLLYKGSTDVELNLFRVRTRKILKYSNEIAASSNIAVASFTGNASWIDIGGISVAIYRIITDSRFIYNTKRKFVSDGFRQLVLG